MNQTSLILDHMKKHGRISPLMALKLFSCMRLGARIHDLRRMGHSIHSEMVSGRNKFGKKIQYKEYWLGSPKCS